MTSFSGECYDGPKEGEKVTHHTHYFTIAYPLDVSIQELMRGPPDEEFHVTTGQYRWSRSLRKWVFIY